MGGGAGRYGLVLLLVALLGGVAYYYSRMGSSNTPKGSKEQIKQLKQVQGQVDNLKEQLKKLVEENQRLKRQTSDLELRKQELKVAKEDVARLRNKVKSCQKFADDVDDEKEMGKSKLKLTRKNLEQEKKMSAELMQRVESVSAKLKETKNQLSEIEKQKQTSITSFQTQRQKYQQLKKDLAEAKSKEEKSGTGDKTESLKIEKLLSDMNKDLRSKSAVISELTKQKRASDEMLRRLEGKLMEAGVDPRDIARVGRPASAPEAPKPNPAAAAMMQVGQGAGKISQQETGMGDIVFQLADDNGDHSLDLDEFVRHVRPSVASRARASGRPQYFLTSRFKEIDLDHSGYITKEEAQLKAPLLIRYLVSKEEMKIFNGTKTADEVNHDSHKADSKEEEAHPEIPKRKGLFSSWSLGSMGSWKSVSDLFGMGSNLKKAAEGVSKARKESTGFKPDTGSKPSSSSTVPAAGKTGTDLKKFFSANARSSSPSASESRYSTMKSSGMGSSSSSSMSESSSRTTGARSRASQSGSFSEAGSRSSEAGSSSTSGTGTSTRASDSSRTSGSQESSTSDTATKTGVAEASEGGEARRATGSRAYSRGADGASGRSSDSGTATKTGVAEESEGGEARRATGSRAYSRGADGASGRARLNRGRMRRYRDGAALESAEAGKAADADTEGRTTSRRSRTQGLNAAESADKENAQ